VRERHPTVAADILPTHVICEAIIDHAGAQPQH
jgi:hypothetical protein